MDNIARLDIESLGRSRYNFKFWRAGIVQEVLKPTLRASATLEKIQFYCEQLSSELLRANQGALRTQPLDSSSSLSKSCEVLYRYLLPENLQKELEKLSHPLLISTNDPSIPWELLHDGREFLALRIPICRDLHRPTNQMTQMPTVENAYKEKNQKISFLFIVNPYDPECELDDSYEECESIMESLDPETISSTYLSDEHATLWEIEKEFVDGHDVIHYAGHAFYDKKRKKGYIQLPENQQLFPEDVKYFKGNPFVFLNGCNTDVGASLAQAFFLKGARGVVGSNVKVPSLQAKTFAVNLYEQLLCGVPSAEAMRLARMATREHYPLDATFLSFILYGHPETTLVSGRDLDLHALLTDKGYLDENHFTDEAWSLIRAAACRAGADHKKRVDLEHLLMALITENK